MYTMQLDKMTEVISHFIGMFEISVEEARQLKTYDEFKIAAATKEETPDLPNTNVNVKAPYTLDDFDPHVPYMGVKPDLVLNTVSSSFWYTPPEIVQHGHLSPGHHHFHLPHLPAFGGGMVLPNIEPPGAIAAYINQEIRLSDNDYVGAGGHGLIFTPAAVDDSSHLASLMNAAADVSPIDDVTLLGTPDDMAAAVVTMGERIAAYTEDPSGEANVFVLHPDATSGPILGTYVNGQLVDDADAPKAEDYINLLKEQHQDDEVATAGPDKDDYNTPPDSSDFMSGWGNGLLSPCVELDTGTNTLINSAVLTNNWTTTSVVATVGNSYEINAIIQINARCDTDIVSSSLNGWKLGNAPDEAFNIAAFKHIDPSSGSVAPTAADGFPAAWVVTQVTGDLIITNWIQQYCFMTDNDTTVMSSSGVRTSVSTGDNTAINDVSLNELGHYYDLIIIGGNIYDANIIQQMNFLIDNDLIGAVDGFQTSGEGSYSTAGNLLWNDATIINVGGQNHYEALPTSYLQAAQDFAAGKDAGPGDILNDPAFAGIGALRVLYISGDLLNVQYVSQTNVLGDSDQVALAMNQFVAHPEAEWTVTTGGNQVANFAGIIDVDGTDKTYVGGEHYSQEILIQADIISSDPELGGQNPDALVNEAIAFLADDAGADDTQMDHLIVPTPDHVQADGVQTILG
ncbi:type I secretion protein [Mesorhizobium sp.]|uniref:type I secretion protein n=1 Tax=Mesorhizobium sp. TaxID=1871066 RepID=UPI000FE5FB24|nr:type I secretion protein [Mesorhizobium sp.]RWI91122.1 MAG: type I secretion protein [Mesorhizobium sp.]TIQ02938.1 MAG: type I secretion protein [Mesorhizobium sp.]TIR18942.1 MAG: type I secretion protein [Mesorhizobium sp.]